MYTRLLPKVHTKGVKKILIRCFGNKIAFEPGIGFGVFDIPILFDYDLFCKSDSNGKKRMTLDTIYTVLCNNYGKMSVDKDTILEPYSIIKDQDFNNIWTWNIKRCPNKKYTAELIVYHEVDYIDFYLLIKDNKGLVLKKERIVSEIPDEWNYKKHLGELKWFSNNEAGLVNKEGNKKWIISVD